jgi:hypothetical protein
VSTKATHADQSLAPAIHWLRTRLQAYLADDHALFAATTPILPPIAPPLQRLSQQVGLSTFEEQILLLCVAAELDPGIGELYAQAQGNPNAFYPTFALALALFADASWAALSAESPLRYWRLIEIDHSLKRPLTLCPLHVDERVINYLQGLNQLDHRLRPFLLPMPFTDAQTRTELVERIELPPSQQAHVDQALIRLSEASGGARWPILQLVGPDSMSKRLVTQQIATRLGVQIYTLPTQLIPPQSKELEDFARLWHRESLLLPLALYVDTTELDAEGANSNTLFLVQQFLARSDGLFLLDTREIWSSLYLPHVILDIGKPAPEEQIAAWESVLPAGSTGLISHLTAQFNLNLPTIQQIGQSTLAEESKNGSHTLPPLPDRLWQACLAYTRPHLDRLAQRITPKATWDDIVLPDEQLQLLHHIADQVSQRSTVYNSWGFRQRSSRGLGITVLFAGESGTGKTMSAEILANHLRLNLYRIDLSAVVSKYIGETEKNLRKLFDAAEDGGALLFFDEADSLFGKRSEVKDSHDRYANIETNYLLQRLEAYQGLAILATNMKSGLDDAFTRRLRFTIVFSKLDETHRRQIWQKAFPPETPVQGLDYAHLARGWKLSGGSIYNIALNAAFMAAKAQRPVGMQQVLAAIRIELSKEDRLLNERDFVWNEESR